MNPVKRDKSHPLRFGRGEGRVRCRAVLRVSVRLGTRNSERGTQICPRVSTRQNCLKTASKLPHFCLIFSQVLALQTSDPRLPFLWRRNHRSYRGRPGGEYLLLAWSNPSLIRLAVDLAFHAPRTTHHAPRKHDFFDSRRFRSRKVTFGHLWRQIPAVLASRWSTFPSPSISIHLRSRPEIGTSNPKN
jgi:hypothetical protein